MTRNTRSFVWAYADLNYLKSCLLVVVSLLLPHAGYTDTSSGLVTQRFTLDGARLTFNGSVEDADGEVGISHPDSMSLRSYLFEHPEIETLELSSTGGDLFAALDMASVLIDFGINTFVQSECSSACTLVFLAGSDRTLAPGGRLGFHSGRWRSDRIRSFYELNREAKGWVDEFAFASWVYEESTRSFNKRLEYLVSRGVDIEFIIRVAYVNSDDIWFPSRDELVNYGILRED